MEPSAWIDSTLSLGLNLTPNYKSNPIEPKVEIKFQEAEDLAEELNRLSGENRKLTEMLSAMHESYNALQLQFADLMRRTSSAAKRKSPESGGTEQSSSSSDEESNVFKKPRESSCGVVNGSNISGGGGGGVAGEIRRKPSSRVLVRTDKSDTSLIVKDGYHWRKYGQKVTRDNPSPRAYFKCSFAPTCQVKKKVQRSAEDQTMLVATYDGEHNHAPPAEIEAGSHSQRSSNLGPATTTNSAYSSAKPRVTLDLIKPVEETKLNRTGSVVLDGQIIRPVSQQFIVEQMASSLSNDPGFKAAVAAAISGRMMGSSNNSMVMKWL